MSGPFEWPEPAWLATVPAADREACRLRFHIGLAALYANPEGSPMKLSEAIGLNVGSLSVAKSRGAMSSETALRIEQMLGRDLFPWQLFLPALILDLGEQ